MSVITVAQMRDLERTAIQAGIPEPELMQQAASGIAHTLARAFPDAPEFIFFCGKGNNGGDGFIAAQLLENLYEGARRIRCFSPYDLQKYDALPLSVLDHAPPLPGAVLIEALLGIGATGPLRPELRLISERWLQTGSTRNGCNRVVAIDVPAGVDADTGEVHPGATRACMTLSCGPLKRGLLLGDAPAQCGRLVPLPLPLPPSALAQLKIETDFLDLPEAQLILPTRLWTAHKGTCGEVHLFAGSPGFSGAATLATEGALHGGAGRVTTWVSPELCPIIASRVAEAMIRPCTDIAEVVRGLPSHAVIVAGPGLGTGTATRDFLHALLSAPRRKIVLDADALTVLAREPDLLALLHDQVLLTPHPGEMLRLLPEMTTRPEAARQFCERHPCALLLKGAGTLLMQRGQTLTLNSTGNPGMATGGMGDVLSGLCGALLAQGLSAWEAARLGAYLHGLAADLAVHGEYLPTRHALSRTAASPHNTRSAQDLRTESYESLLPRHLLAHLGAAFTHLRHG